MTHITNEPKKTHSKTLEPALKSASRGIPVLPAHYPQADGKCSCGKPECQSVGKHPWTLNGYKDASIDPTVIRGWFNEQPRANLAWRMGELPGKKGSIVCLDIDPRNGGNESLNQLISEVGELPPTWTEATGGDGSHSFLYSSERIKSATPLRGIDLLSDGKIVVVSPSLHRSGKFNHWLPGLSPDEIPIARFPEKLRNYLAGKGRAVPPGGNSSKEEFEKVIQSLPYGIAEGGRNNALTRIAGHLLSLKALPAIVREALQSLNRTHMSPPLHPDEVDQIFTSILGLEKSKRVNKGGAR